MCGDCGSTCPSAVSSCGTTAGGIWLTTSATWARGVLRQKCREESGGTSQLGSQKHCIGTLAGWQPPLQLPRLPCQPSPCAPPEHHVLRQLRVVQAHGHEQGLEVRAVAQRLEAGGGRHILSQVGGVKHQALVHAAGQGRHGCSREWR